ncbi:MAG: ATP-binding protein [Candidatus Kapabacteria bacterium]|nr:ATP-binding protein [Candidatus Kapabacteria bacterium]
MIELRLPSVLQSIRAIEPAVSGLPGWGELSEQIRHNVVLSTTELVTNAIIHGNRSQQDRLVVVEVEIKTSEIVIVVADEGAGFDLAAIADPTDAEHRERLSGRGLYIVRNLVHSLTVDRAADSCRVTIIIRLS